MTLLGFRSPHPASDGCGTVDDAPPTLAEAVLSAAARYPTSVAVTCGGVDLTYAQLARRVAAVRASLAAHGVGRHDIVGVLQRRGHWLIPSMLGVAAAGAAFVPLDPNYPAARLRRYVDVARPAAVLSDAACHPIAVGLCDTVIEPKPAAVGAPAAAEGMAPDDLVYVLFTSGSTGQPKGVAIPHGGLANLMVAMRERLGGPSRDDVMVAHATVSFDISIPELFLPLTVGGTVLMATDDEAKSPEHLISLLERATIAQATPSMWRILLANGWSPGPGLTVVSGGEAMTLPLARRLAATSAALWNFYGPTEATVWASAHRVRPEDEYIPIGPPLSNVGLHVLDEQLKPCSRGELHVSGVQLAREYLGDPAGTSAAFRIHPESGERIYRTGDTVRVRDDGAIEFLGRGKAELKIRGNRIAPQEIERELESIGGIKAAVVAARSFEGRGDEMLAAYVVTARPVTKDELNRELAARVPAHMIPDVYVVLPGIPLLPNGKLDATALPAPSGHNILSTSMSVTRGPAVRGAGPAGVDVPPEPAVVAAICEVFARILGQDTFDSAADFFDSGGQSAAAAVAAGMLTFKLKRKVSIATIFAARSPEALAALMSQPVS